MEKKTRKIVKRDYYEILLAYIEATDFPTYVKETETNTVDITKEQVTEFLVHELELLDNKRDSAREKQTPRQIENSEIREAILDALADGTAMTITDMIKNIPACADLMNQRCSAIVRNLVAEDRLERFEEKRKAYFRII